MLERLTDLPAGVDAIRASGRVSREDYERVFRPLLEAAQSEGRRVRLLYEFAPSFQGFTVAAGLEDAYLGLRHLRLFERCAIVSDIPWLRESARLLDSVMPCPVAGFQPAEREQAIAWVSSTPA